MKWVAAVYNLTRFKQWQAFFASLAFFYGITFYLAGSSGIDAMAPGMYGDLAVDRTVEGWALIQLCGSVLLCMGIAVNGRSRWSCIPRLIGAMTLVGLIYVLAASAFTAQDGWPTGLFCFGFASWGLPVIWWNTVDLIGAIRRGE